MKILIAFITALAFISPALSGYCKEVPLSEATQECLECHAIMHPGIVESWQTSRHALMTPKAAMGVQGLGRKVSSTSIPESLQHTAVGCAECHTLRPEKHKDTVDHNGHDIHVVVSPNDCATCHTEEAGQYANNIMSHAVGNLAENPVYQALQESIIGKPVLADGKIAYRPSSSETKADACYYCHGTRLEVTGFETRENDFAEVKLPIIRGWPNQGVGRINLDGSRGACTPCHTRHAFSIEMARKPYTCRECHVGPDVPAYKVYSSSKHGNIFSAMNGKWNFTAVPWTTGRDFAAPTCATCHISLVVNTEGETIAKRTHQMNDRLSWRIFGLIYAHPHPLKPDTTIIRNSDGLSLPTDFNGKPAESFLIKPQEQKTRTETMQSVCLGCHDASWVKGHWAKYTATINETNDTTRTATRLMAEIWQEGFARGLDKNENPFDEAVEKKWADIWLFHANTIRFSSAMAGGGDYGAFADGRYQLSQKIQELYDWLELRKHIRKEKSSSTK